MGRRGPAPERNILNLNGTDYEEIENGANTEESKYPQPHRNMHPVAKKYWRQIYPLLAQDKKIKEVDHGALRQLCQSYSDVIQIEEALTKFSCKDKEGNEYKGLVPYLETHNSQTAMLWTALKSAREQYRNYCKVFGLTPYDRVSLPNTKKENKNNAFSNYRNRSASGGEA